MSPVALALVIVLAVTAAGVLIHIFRTRAQFRGYEEISADARQIAKRLGADLFRDGNDLVISGSHSKFPVIIRFSYDENTPGMNIRMNAPASFTMSVVPKGARAAEGRVLVRTESETFDARFVTRSDQPTQAKMLLASKPVRAAMERLCCSPKTFLTITTGVLEQSELVIPPMYLARHVLDHVDQMRTLAEAARSMPGADKVKVEPLRRERRLAMRALIAAGAVAALIAVAAAVQAPRQQLQAQTIKLPDGVPPAAAELIPNISGWRTAASADFPGPAAAWATNNGQPPSGVISGDFSGNENAIIEGAYVFLNAAGDHRIVLLAANKVAWDVSMPQLAAVARVPKGLFGAIEWASKDRPVPDGDGLLLVRDGADRRSGVVVFLVNGKPSTAAPADYQRVRLD